MFPTLFRAKRCRVKPWSSLVVGDEGWIGPSKKLLCLCTTPKNYASHAWHNSIVVWLLGRSFYLRTPWPCTKNVISHCFRSTSVEFMSLPSVTRSFGGKHSGHTITSHQSGRGFKSIRWGLALLGSLFQSHCFKLYTSSILLEKF